MEDKTKNRLPWIIIPLILIFGIAATFVVFWWQTTSFDQRLKKEQAKHKKELEAARKTIKKLTDKLEESERKEETSTAGTEMEKGSTKPSLVKQCGYIKRLYEKGGKNFLDLDYVEFLTGEAANQAAREDGKIEPGETVPNDCYVRNRSSKIRTFEIGDKVEVLVKEYHFEGETLKNRLLNFATFKTMFKTNDPSNQYIADSLYWITLHDNVVTEIEEQYVP